MPAPAVAIEGYASLFGVADRAADVVARGAFRRTLTGRRRPMPLLYQHRIEEPIGRLTVAREDGRGLFVRALLHTDVARARDAAALARAGTLTGLSIGYRPVRAKALPRGRRLVIEIDLWEISLVTFPMLDGARVRRVIM